MVTLLPSSTAKKKSAPANIITVDELVAKSVFEKEFSILKKELETQQSITWQVVIGVAVAFVLAVGVIIVDGILSRNSSNEIFESSLKEINQQDIEINNLNNKIENLFIRNSYLRQ